MNKQAARLYVRKGQAYVTPQSETVDGTWTATSPCVAVGADETEKIAGHILAALDLSKSGVPTPGRAEKRDAELLELAGMQTFAAFANGTLVVDITALRASVTLTPLRRARRGGFFESMDSDAITVDREVAAVAAGLPAALELAE